MDKLDGGLFADYRSEWIGSDFDERFVEPPYYRRFLGIRPTFLIGGRGTGKTIALRSLHFSNKDSDGKPRHLGIYVKAFKNRITAFSGSHLEDRDWITAFEHYMNLLCCVELADLCMAVFHKDGTLAVAQQDSIQLLCEHFSIAPAPADYADLHRVLRVELARLTKYIVAPRLVARPSLSPGELPVVDFARDVHRAIEGQHGRPIYICIDEWENLSERQQEVMNGWIKNSTAPISYKLGVRQDGILTRATGGSNDPLASPADYSDEDVSGDEKFCMQVVEKRLDLARRRGSSTPSKLSQFLRDVEPREEAEILGARTIVEKAAAQQDRDGYPTVGRWLRQTPLDEAYLALYVHDKGLGSLVEVVTDALKGSRIWKSRVENYRYASLFTVTKGQKGVALRKLYTGQKTFLTLSGGNVRFLLELLDEVVRVYLREDHEQAEVGEQITVGGLVQSRAATAVAKRHLDQIQGLSTHGPVLERLVRSIGTAFHGLIRNPKNRAPEKTGFILKGEREAVDEAKLLLKEGCAILSFVSEEPSKLTHPAETQEKEYRLHPILTPHFNVSHRRKRRLAIDAGRLLEATKGVEGARALLTSITGEEVSERQMELLVE